MDLRTTLLIPSGGDYFEGHFPGRPILPGVTQIAMVMDALKKANVIRDGKLQGITHTRLRQIVMPGDTLELTTKNVDDRHVRFELKRDNAIVTNGEFYTGERDSSVSVPPLPEVVMLEAESPSIDNLLPHRAPMRFLQSVISETADSVICLATIPSECVLVKNGYAPAITGVEVAAQAAAAWEALQRQRTEGEAVARVGYLVALRDITFISEDIPADKPLHVIVKLEAAVPPLSHYRMVLFVDGNPIVEGMLATFLTQDEL